MSNMFPRTTRRSQLFLMLLGSAALAACGGGGGGGGTSGGPPINPAAAPNVPVTVAGNPADGDKVLRFYNSSLNITPPQVFDSGSNEGIDYDATATLVQAGDDMAGFSGLRFFNLPTVRTGDGAAFNAAVDREIDLSGGMVVGKGIEILDELGRIIVADIGTPALQVFSSTAGQGAAALASIPLANAAWDIKYDTANDRLYAALTNGTLAIFDNFSADLSASATASRTLTPVDAMDTQVSANFHGIDFIGGSSNTVIVSDVGAITAGDGARDDGALFVFTDDGMVDGNVAPADYRRVAGTDTLLGNPVDLIQVDGVVLVAEKANNQILAFNTVATEGSGNVEPDFNLANTAPESLAVSDRGTGLPADATDIDTATAIANVAVTSNPAPMTTAVGGVVTGPGDGNGIISFLSAADLSSQGSFDANDGSGVNTDFRSLENIQFDAAGDAYVVFDTGNQTGPANTGVLVLNRLSSRDGGSTDAPNTDREITGANSALTGGRGIEVVQSRGVMIVADFGGSAIRVYGLQAGPSDDFAPLFSTTDVGSGSVWDLDYDPTSDTLFAAGTMGELLVYRNYLATAAATGGDVAPIATRLNSDSMATSNLHGIVHVAASNQLIVSDVGDAADADDGLIYVVANANATTPTVTATITGPSADTLGNPVDLAYDGTALFVAEKSDGMVYRYTGILAASSGALEPAHAVAVTAPESISLDR